MQSQNFKISVITATYNAVAVIPGLIDSLRGQIDKDFEWVVADGASSDGTVELLESIRDLNVKVVSEPDFGIYDALNRAIKCSSGDYYVVIGADDLFYSNAISDYRAAICSGDDIVTACIEVDGCVIRPRPGYSWLYGQRAFVSGHAVGSLIRKGLHDSFGYYSRKFPIVADQLFVKKCCQSGSRVKVIDSVVGGFSLGGVSGADVVGTLTEFFRVQLVTERFKFLQVALYVFRLLKNYKRL